MYGQNKLFSEQAEKKAMSEYRRLKKEHRKANPTVPKLEIGMELGRLTLVDRDWKKGYFGMLHRSKWKCDCRCGHEKCKKTVTVAYWKLVSGYAYSCGAVKRPRKMPAQTRPPNVLPKRVYGRLTVKKYETNKGWLCVCRVCKLEEYVRYSRLLERYGQRVCINRDLSKKR